MQEATHIPTDLDACQTLILEQARTLLDIQKSKEDLAKEVSELKLQITRLMQRLYGQKSERNTDDPNQLQFGFADDEQANDAVSSAVLDAEKF
nr:transposase [Planctomyces sp.]